MAASVKDTAAWRLIVPLRPALNLTGSRLIATATAAFGGMVVQLDSSAGSITWIADHATGLTDALTVVVPVAARGGWRALGANGRPGVVTVFVDVLRGVGGAVPEEDLGRTSFAVFPGTASPAVASPTGGLQPVLSAIPCGGVLLPALQTGPQGPAGGEGGESMPKQTVYQITAAASFIASHSFSYRPATLLLLPSGEEVETDTAFTDGQVSLTFAAPFTGTLYLG